MYNGQVRLITENEVVTMKKKLLVVCMAFTMMFSFTACGKQETTETEAATEAGVTVGAEVEQFVNRDLPSISSERDKAVRLYKAYFEKSMDSEQWLSSLENDAITSYDSYLEKLKGFEYTTAEVQNLQSQYLQRRRMRFVILHLNNSAWNSPTILWSSCITSNTGTIPAQGTRLFSADRSLQDRKLQIHLPPLRRISSIPISSGGTYRSIRERRLK